MRDETPLNGELGKIMNQRCYSVIKFKEIHMVSCKVGRLERIFNGW